jgi:hypothetical protein
MGRPSRFCLLPHRASAWCDHEPTGTGATRKLEAMHLPSAPVQATLAALLLATLTGCAVVRQPNATGEEKRLFLFESVAAQAATGPKDCQLYVDGLSGRLARSPYRYKVRTLYFCSLGAECHVVLKVNTGDALFASDNGAFIKGNIESLAAFDHKRSRTLSWREINAGEAQLMLMAERYVSRP